MYQEYANSRLIELEAAATTIKHRMEWEQLSRIDRLERALKVAGSRLSAPFGALKTNN
jgi:hypothetical protein